MSEAIIYDPIERFLFPIGICLLLVAAILYFNNGRNNESKNQRMIMYGFSSWLLSFSFYLSFLYLAEFYLIGEIQNFVFYADYNQFETNSTLFRILGLIGGLLLYVFFAFFIYSFEYNFRKTRFLLTFFSASIPIIFIILFMTFPNEQVFSLFAKTIGWPSLLILSNYVIFTYTKHSDLRFKGISAVLIFGLMMVEYAIVFRDHDMKSTNSLPIIIAPILLIVGSLISLSPVLVHPNKFSKALPYWKYLGYILIIFMTIFSLLLLIGGFPILYTIISIFYILVMIYILKIVIGLINNETNLNIEKKIKKERTMKESNVLEMFSRPDNIDLDESNYMRDNKICIVCKKEVSKYAYICSTCEGYYCFNCANALTDIENACWVCNAPFDDSKPTKLAAPEEEPLKIGISKGPSKRDEEKELKQSK